MHREQSMSEEESLEGVPFMAVGNDELGAALGKTIKCPQCFKEHDITEGTVRDPVTGKQVPSDMLQFYKCGDTTYLAGIKGKRIK